MRKITRITAAAFEAGKEITISNTCVSICFCGGVKPNAKLYLHNNPIAERDAQGRVFISAAGWLTNTTKERLNGLSGVDIVQRRGQWYLNGKAWNGEKVCLQDWNNEKGAAA